MPVIWNLKTIMGMALLMITIRSQDMVLLHVCIMDWICPENIKDSTTCILSGAAGHDIYVRGYILDPFIQQGWVMDWPSWPTVGIGKTDRPIVISGACRSCSGVADRSGNSWSLHNEVICVWKTLELGYTLPKALTKKAAIDRVCVYINNLTFTNRDGLMKNVDPESNQRGAITRKMKTYNFGVNVTF